jgi:glycosyltransferase involved in cell wall biosynthesis
VPAPLSCLLVTPISPQEVGNGLAHRCRFWQRALADLGPVRTVLLPVSGQVHAGDDAVALPVVAVDGPDLPSRARWAPEHLGRAWRAAEHGAIDLVLALRADVAGFALGAAAASDSFVAVDLDDDDAALAVSLGQDEEAARCRAWQATLASRADLLLSATGFGTTTAVPNSVAVGNDPGPRPPAPTSTLLMVGNFTYEPNLRGAAWFVAEVLPRVAAAVPGVRLVLAGHESERFEPHGVGYVEDLDQLQREAAVAIVPLLHGSGTRIKALDAFAARLPVVGTTVGLSGLPVEPDVHCLVADDPEAFADAVVRLLSDAALSARLADAARSLVERFDLGAVEREAADLLRAAVADRAPTVLAAASDLIVTEESDGLVVVDEASMTAHHLNELATAVFLLAEAPATAESIAAAFADTVERPVAEVRELVNAAISALVGGGLLQAHHGPQPR